MFSCCLMLPQGQLGAWAHQWQHVPCSLFPIIYFLFSTVHQQVCALHFHWHVPSALTAAIEVRSFKACPMRLLTLSMFFPHDMSSGILSFLMIPNLLPRFSAMSCIFFNCFACLFLITYSSFAPILHFVEASSPSILSSATSMKNLGLSCRKE